MKGLDARPVIEPSIKTQLALFPDELADSDIEDCGYNLLLLIPGESELLARVMSLIRIVFPGE